MIVDDRLETVLRTHVAGKTAARTQLRQLVDLLGTVPMAGWNSSHATALQRIEALCEILTDEECAAVLRAVPHRSPMLVYHFGQGTPRSAAAAIATARLTDEDWLALIPRLPSTARGFVRHRSDLGKAVRDLLSRLGVNDFLLPQPASAEAPAASAKAPAMPVEAVPSAGITVEKRPAAPAAATASAPLASLQPEDGIGAIVRRIEAFRRKREERDAPRAPGGSPAAGIDGVAPRLPFAEEQATTVAVPQSLDLRTDAAGMVVHTRVDPPGMILGSRIFATDPAAPVHCDEGMAMAFRQRQPVAAGHLHIEGAPAIAGTWQADGTPLFARDNGRFTGYLLRLRRPLGATTANAEKQAHDNTQRTDEEADRLRQLLHELRTPINAIQGFAEMIQSQVFGATPHQYRAMAASIASDAAQMLAGFEEVERLVKLESRAIALDPGESDAGAIVARLIEQLSPVLASRNVRLSVTMPPAPLPIALAPQEVERMVWRVLTVIAASVAPGERLSIVLEAVPSGALLSLPLPAALARLDDVALFAPEAGPAASGSFTAPAMLGSGFALRLARAECEAGGGILERENARLSITLPCPSGTPQAPRAVVA